MPPVSEPPPALRKCPNCNQLVNIVSFISSRNGNSVTKRCAKCRKDKRTLESLQSPTKPPKPKRQQKDQREALTFLPHGQNSQDDLIIAQARCEQVAIRKRHRYEDRQCIEHSITPSLNALVT
ncbi:hypothetical protein B7463_g3411, partial [Scytalidium lignicola]